MTSRDQTSVLRGRFIVAGLAVLTLACGSDRIVLQIGGNWHLQESFEDGLHLVACSGEGQVVVTQDMTGDQSTGVNSPDSTFSATAGVDTDCTSQDGPFSYFGNGTFPEGVLTSGDAGNITWSGTVNDAVCEYQGVVTGDDVFGMEMSGTLTCLLETPGVTFNFEGTWVAHSARSQWCLDRPQLAGCA